jgi:hypothetical protein
VGYIPDLLEKISRHINKKFTLKIVGDGKYGAKADGVWNGMIGEVIRGVSMNSGMQRIYIGLQHPRATH